MHRKFTLSSTPVVVSRPNMPKKSQDHEKAHKWTGDVEKVFSHYYAKLERWVPFDGLKILRNSNFDLDELSDEQLEEIGGIEYRALRLLTYLV